MRDHADERTTEASSPLIDLRPEDERTRLDDLEARLERLEVGMRLLADAMKRAHADLSGSVREVRALVALLAVPGEGEAGAPARRAPSPFESTEVDDRSASRGREVGEVFSVDPEAFWGSLSS
jgi:hypothetical protein